MPHRCDLKCGYMTVFLSAVLLVMTGFLLAVYGNIRTDAARKDADLRTAVAVRSILGDYCRPLYERYGILAIDGGYDTKKMNFEAAEARIREILEANDSILPYGAALVNVDRVGIISAEMLVDSDYSALKENISDFVKKRLTVIRTKELLGEASRLNGIMDEKEELERKLKEGKTEEELLDTTEEEAYEGMTPTEIEMRRAEKKKDPRRKVNALGRKGLMRLVLPEGFKVSDREIALDCCYTQEGGAAIPYIRDFRSYDDVGNTLGLYNDVFDTASEELFINEYILGVAGNALKNNDKPGLRYGTEFIITGAGEDSEALSRTAHRIVLLRTAVNAAHIMADPGKYGEASAAAAALTWWCPPLQPGVCCLIISAWAYAEAVIDVRTLFGGGRVPLIKGPDDWKLSFGGLLKLSFETVSELSAGSGRGLDYEDYLRILLLAVPNNKKYARLCGLIEGNIRCTGGYEGFCISNCMTGISVSCGYRIDGSGGYTVKHAASY